MVCHFEHAISLPYLDYCLQLTSVQYETVDQVVALVQECGQGCFIAKADIKDAFRPIPNKPQICHLLGMTWQEQFYHDKVLPMGCAISCQTFEPFSSAAQWTLVLVLQLMTVSHICWMISYLFMQMNRYVAMTFNHLSCCHRSQVSLSTRTRDVCLPLAR